MTDLYPFIGIDEQGKPRIYISPFGLYRVSPMHVRGKGFPEEVKEALDEKTCFQSLVKLQKYYNAQENKASKKSKAS